MARFGSFDTHITEGVCTWHIQGPRYYIKLHVYIFIEKLKESEDCSLEYLEVSVLLLLLSLVTHVSTAVVPAKSDSHLVLCSQLLSKTLTC